MASSGVSNASTAASVVTDVSNHSFFAGVKVVHLLCEKHNDRVTLFTPVEP